MAETAHPLELFYRVSIPSSGVVSQLSIGPVKSNERWEITTTSVKASLRCTFTSYSGNRLLPEKQIDFTNTGDGDVSNTLIPLASQETISFAFRGPSGTIAEVKFLGTRYVRGR